MPGTNTAYLITVTNNGPSTVTGATVSDVLPAGTTFVAATNGATYDAGTNTVTFVTGTLATGGSTSFHLTLAIDAGLTGSLANTATVTPPSGVTDPTGGNNSSTDTDTLTPRADLSISKTDGKTSAVPGTDVTYTITVTNSGPSTVVDALVSDPLPAGTRSSAPPAAPPTTPARTRCISPPARWPRAADISFDLTLTIGAGLTGTLSNTATVAPPAGVTDPNTANDSATDTDTLTSEADLSIAKTDGLTSAVPGTNVTYTITVTNNGPSTVTGATVSDVLPLGLIFVSATNGATFDAGTSTVHFTTGTLAPGGTASFQLTVTLAPGLTGHGEQHRNRGASRQRDRPEHEQRQRHRHRHADAPGRPGHHQERRHEHRDPRHEHHVHDHGHEQRAEHGHRCLGQRRTAHWRHLRLGHERRHL